MGLYGPFIGTAGQVQRCDVDPEAQGVYVRNTSIYDLAISFKPAQPVGGASFGGGDWFEVVPSGDRAGLRIPNGLYGGGPFPGYVWILPIDNTGNLALTGTTSANKQFWIASYPDAAAMPSDYASAQFQNVASQSRTIALPMASTSIGSATVTLGSGQSTVTNGNKLTASNNANGNVVIYLYGAVVSLGNAATVSGIDFQLEVAILKGDRITVQVGPQALFQVYLYAGTTTAPINGLWTFTPPIPWAFNLPYTPGPNAVYWAVRLTAVSILNTPTLTYGVLADADSLNLNAIADIGNSQTAQIGAIAPGQGIY